MLKQFNKLVGICLLILLSSCSLLEPKPRVDETIINTSIYAHGATFTLAGLPAYVEEKEVYRIADEQELALLSLVKSEEEVLKVNFVSDEPISLNKTFAYLESVLPYSFKLSLGEMNYTRKDELLMSLQSLEIMPMVDVASQVMKPALDWNESYITSDMTQKEMIKVYHDQLLLNTKYDTSVLDLDLSIVQEHPSFEAMGVFLYRTAVCSGYARAFNALAKTSKIPSLIVSSLSMQHAWNLVYDGYEWKYIDVTFNDPIPDRQDRVLYTYYLLNEKQFLSDGKHRFDPSADNTLSADEYLEFAYQVYPETRP